MRLESEPFHEFEILATVDAGGGQHVVGDGCVGTTFEGPLAVVAQDAAAAREADKCLRIDKAVNRHDAAELVVRELREILVGRARDSVQHIHRCGFDAEFAEVEAHVDAVFHGFAEAHDAAAADFETCGKGVLECANLVVVGMGGATFPTHVKLSIPEGKKAEILIINGVECEPYLTSDYRTMLERGEELLVGTSILMKAVSVEKAVIGVENNKPDAIKHLKELAKSYNGIEVKPLKTMYPQGGEKQLIAAVTGREVPAPPALPIDVGAVVCNASTAVAVYEAVQKNKPLVQRVVTVTGKSIKDTKNLLTRFGTPVSALIEKCGGLPEGDNRVLNGGPMMGRPMSNLQSPVMKGCSGITVISGKEALRGEPSACIKCAKCIEACPMGLEPYLLAKQSKKKAWGEMEKNDITSCIECGCCQFTCPANIALLDYVRLGKQTVMGIIRARNAKK